MELDTSSHFVGGGGVGNTHLKFMGWWEEHFQLPEWCYSFWFLGDPDDHRLAMHSEVLHSESWFHSKCQ